MLEKFQTTLPKVEGKYQIYLDLNSKGGRVDIAMKIGRQIRNLQAITRIEKQGSCASACVLILVAGVVRAYQSLYSIEVTWPPSVDSILPTGTVLPSKLVG